MNPCSRRTVLGLLGASAGVSALSWSKLVAAKQSGSVAPTVKTTGGSVRGLDTGGVYAYRGIPYAASTGGAGRFKPPAVLQGWAGVRQLGDCGAPCPQYSPWFPAWVDPRPQSEECLFLNVWSPREAHGSKLPVMVWFHGGGFSTGSGGAPLFDGVALAHHSNVIVVTVNHRLNAFGYMYVGGVSERYADSSNLGQRDLIASLEWVRDNIAAFGGDPGNVTIFGESGGGGKVTTLLSMPRSQNLFHKAIVQSGSLWKMHTREDAEDVCNAVLHELRLGAKDLAKLLALPPDRLVKATLSSAIGKRNGLPFRPMVDGTSLPHQDWDTAAPEAARKIPMLIGTNHDEGSFFVPDLHEPPNDAELTQTFLQSNSLNRISAEQAHALIEGYRKESPKASRTELLVAISGDVMFWRSAVAQSERKAQQGGAPVFMYRFDWNSPCFGGSWSTHGAEVPFVFGNMNYNQACDAKDTPDTRAKADPSGERLKLADKMMTAWAEFARKGDPSTASLPRWPKYDPTQRATMKLDATCAIENDPRGAQRKLLDTVLGPA